VTEDVKEQIANNLKVIQKYRLLSDKKEVGKNIQITPFSCSEEIKDIVAIDGSYSFLLNLSSMWLAVIRVGAMHYRYTEDKGYELVDSEASEKLHMVSTNKDIMTKMGDLQSTLFTATRYASEQHREMVNQLRRLSEEEMALKMASENKNVIIAMDGTLTPLKSTDTMERAINECTKNNNILIGVSKDSYTHTFKSHKTDEEVLLSLDQDGMGYVKAPYIPSAKKASMLYGGMLGDMYFAKLHTDSKKWFRIDLGTYKSEPDKVFSCLSHYSKSRLCLGYIYPLLEAHRYVVTVRHFHNLYEDLILDMAGEYDISLQEVISGLTHLEGERKGAFHEYLDKVSREV
jgi:hypothetical protein